MLKNWNDPVGNKLRSNLNKSINSFNVEQNKVNNDLNELNKLLIRDIKVKFNKKNILALKAQE